MNLKYSFFLLPCLLNLYSAQAQETIEKNGTIGYNNNSTGSISWSNVSDALNADNSYATATALALGSPTNYLVISDFGFSLPTSSTIQGITVNIEGHANGLFANSVDHSVKIVKEAIITGSEKKKTTNWPATDTDIIYGGTADAWGTTWTVEEINSKDFGVAVSVHIQDLLFPTVSIDEVKISVHYLPAPLPVNLVYFKGIRENDRTVNLTWATATETDNDFFTVEYSENASDWEELKHVKGKGNSQIQQYYEITLENNSANTTYYRLKQTDFSGTYQYSGLIAIPPANTSGFQADFYPNPSSGTLQLYATQDFSAYNIYRSDGVLLDSQILPSATTNQKIELKFQEAGVYFVKLLASSGQCITKKIVVE